MGRCTAESIWQEKGATHKKSSTHTLRSKSLHSRFSRCFIFWTWRSFVAPRRKRSLAQTEQRYEQIEKEALAFTWACEGLSDYLIGLQFHIWTDQGDRASTHQSAEIPTPDDAVQLYYFPHAWQDMLTTADTLSRSPLKHSSNTDNLQQESDAYVKLVMQSLPATEKRIKQIKESQQRDETCQL